MNYKERLLKNFELHQSRIRREASKIISELVEAKVTKNFLPVFRKLKTADPLVHLMVGASLGDTFPADAYLKYWFLGRNFEE